MRTSSQSGHYRWAFIPAAALVLGLGIALLNPSSPDSIISASPEPSVATIFAAPATTTLSLDNAALIVAESQASAGISLISADGAVQSNADGDQPFVLASVGKLYVLASFLSAVEAEGREPTRSELSLLEDMIMVSDNEAAHALWDEANGIDGLQLLLAAHALDLVVEPVDGSWGSMGASAGDVARLLNALYNGELLNSGHTALALQLLGSVSEAQSWGIGAGLEDSDEATVLLKNGWYPEDDGWRINSAGIIETDGFVYSLVVLSEAQSTYQSGVDVVEAVAASINGGVAGAAY